jgi:hypothetical protein
MASAKELKELLKKAEEEKKRKSAPSDAVNTEMKKGHKIISESLEEGLQKYIVNPARKVGGEPGAAVGAGLASLISGAHDLTAPGDTLAETVLASAPMGKAGKVIDEATAASFMNKDKKAIYKAADALDETPLSKIRGKVAAEKAISQEPIRNHLNMARQLRRLGDASNGALSFTDLNGGNINKIYDEHLYLLKEYGIVK